MTTTETTMNLKERALAELRASRAVVVARDAELRERHRMTEVAHLGALIKKVFGVEAEAAWDEKHARAEIRVEDMVFVCGIGDVRLYLLGACGTCGDLDVAYGIAGLADLGAVIEEDGTRTLYVPGQSTEYGPLMHRCPRLEAAPAPQAPPTVEERLLDALRDFVVAQREAF